MKICLNLKHPLLTFLLLALIVYTLGTNLYSHRHTLTTPFDLNQAAFVYSHSQYNLSAAQFYGNIDDQTLYSYAGYQYFTGTNPATLNPEAPYLFKYLYGLSIFLFGNGVVLQFLVGQLTLFLAFYLTYFLTRHFNLALLSLFLLSQDFLFQSQWFATDLDLPHAFTILLTLTVFLYFLKKPTSQLPLGLLLTSLCLGTVATTKLFITAIPIYFILLFFIPKSTKNIILLTIPAVIFYFLTFTNVFLHQPSLIYFFNLHLQIAKLYKSYLPNYPWGQLLNIIFLGRWSTWWGQGTISVPGWSVTWPLATLASLYSLFCHRHLKSPVTLLSLVIVTYLVLNLTHVVFPRYLLSVLPLMYILTSVFISQITQNAND